MSEEENEKMIEAFKLWVFAFQVMLYYFNSPNKLRLLSSPTPHKHAISDGTVSDWTTSLSSWRPDEHTIPDEIAYTILKRK